MTNENTPTPLYDVVQSGESKWWRLSKEDSERVTHIMIWDEETNTKVKGVIDEMERVTQPHVGYIVRFTPQPLSDGTLYRSVKMSNRPRFDRRGIYIG